MKRELIADYLGLSGTGLLSYGAWLVYPPAGFIVGGALLLAAGWLLGASAPVAAPEQEGA